MQDLQKFPGILRDPEACSIQADMQDIKDECICADVQDAEDSISDLYAEDLLIVQELSPQPELQLVSEALQTESSLL